MADVELRKNKDDLRALELVVKNQKTEISLLFKNKRNTDTLDRIVKDFKSKTTKDIQKNVEDI